MQRPAQRARMTRFDPCLLVLRFLCSFDKGCERTERLGFREEWMLKDRLVNVMPGEKNNVLSRVAVRPVVCRRPPPNTWPDSP